MLKYTERRSWKNEELDKSAGKSEEFIIWDCWSAIYIMTRKWFSAGTKFRFCMSNFFFFHLKKKEIKFSNGNQLSNWIGVNSQIVQINVKLMGISCYCYYVCLMVTIWHAEKTLSIEVKLLMKKEWEILGDGCGLTQRKGHICVVLCQKCHWTHHAVHYEDL